MKHNRQENDVTIALTDENRDSMPEPKNLLEGMQTILEYAENSGLSDTYFNNVKIPMDYLSRRLNLTPVQVTLLAVLMEFGYQRSVSLGQLSRYLGTSNLDLLSRSGDLSTLQTRRFIFEIKCIRDKGYTISEDVYNAFRHNEVYSYKIPSLHNDDELVEHLDRMLSILDNRDSDYNTSFFDNDLRDLLFANSHIRLARTLLSVLKKCSENEFRVVVLMSMLWIRDDEVDIEGHRFCIVIKNQLEVQQMISKLQNNASFLVKKKIVMISNTEGILSRNVFALTPNFRKSLTPDRMTSTGIDEELQSRLTRCTDIVPKSLFYNTETVEEVDRLQHLLNPEQMNGILARLKEKGLRGGFTCLLYGGPGTGKTETVLQLAKGSGRDIFQIDISNLRSKWYGESERLVKGVFDDYRHLVKKSKVAPIMLFNEADAIFTRRMNNAQRTVDKSENALQNIILQEMETLDGILIATTNLPDNLDNAFERRFLYKLHLDKPSADVKARIWKSMLPDLTEAEALSLASQFDFSGGQIENVVRKRFIDEVLTGEKINIEALQTLCRNEQLGDKKKQKIGYMHYAG